MFNFIVENHKNPSLLVVTPLRPTDKVSKETRVSVKRNDVSFSWITYKSEGNVVQNFKRGMKEFESEYGRLPKYVIKIDNDTVWSRNTLDKMVESLDKSVHFEVYTYCSFEYRGAIQAQFPAIPFDDKKLKKANYISSNSMFKSRILKEIEMPDEDKYIRLLDWAYYLKLLRYGFIGKPSKGFFYVNTSAESISAKSNEDYRLKYQRVYEDFILR